MTLLRASRAPAPRTLVSIFEDTVVDHPDDPAVDNGAAVLTYQEFHDAATVVAAELNEFGIGRGDRVGVRITSGTLDLYVAIMGTLLSGACYVPVDADDPDERARTVFAEADVAAIVGDDLVVTPRRSTTGAVTAQDPSPTDDAWVIFTSGSTGVPKGVAVSHRSAAGFVDAEARLYLQDDPLGVGDRVMAGLSVAFDASCEEMWLAWRYGACLVPAPRSLVRSGMELGPWLVANDITVVSTVPTLLLLWPVEALADVRLLILGGEACPPEIGSRFASAEREVWNTYGPTEATVVSCGAQLTADGPVRIGLPLDGWDLAVVDEAGHSVGPGQTGELIIGGIGLARYLDPAKDAEKYAAMPTLGWSRAYRSGDLVRNDDEGLVFVGRADDQVKVGGRRIELGEIDNALLNLTGVVGAAAAVQSTRSGNKILIGYVAVDNDFDAPLAMQQLRENMPAALVPRLAQVDEIPTKTSGKVDRDALPWPLPHAEVAASEAPLDGTAGWVQELWMEILGADVTGLKDDFFVLGGGSLTAAQLVARLRERHPEITVADIYESPTVGTLSAAIDTMASPSSRTNQPVRPVPVKTQVGQVALTVALRTIAGLRWLTWTAASTNAAGALFDVSWLPQISWWVVTLGWLLLISPPGRILLTVAGARTILRKVEPGEHPRGGNVHLRLWFTERLAEELGAANLTSAPWMRQYARALGAKIGRDVDLQSIPPVTGLLTLGSGCAVEPEVDLSGYWIDGEVVHLGPISVGKGARVGARSTLLPGASIGARAEIAPGSAVFGVVPADEAWSGAPAHRVGAAKGAWEESVPSRHPAWVLGYAAMAIVISILPLVAMLAGVSVALPAIQSATTLGEAALTALLYLPLGVAITLVVLAFLIWLLVRILSFGVEGGYYPVRSLRAWQAWSILRVLDEARTWLFPIYSSSLTPWWLRALGARVGSDVEASTVLMLPRLTSVSDGAFLADDTMIGGYELNGGWMRLERVKVGKHAFVGNSGMTAPGRKVPKRGLVAVLSAAPKKKHAKSGTSWIGSPPTQLRRDTKRADESRTYRPPARLRLGRAAVELLRLVPVTLNAAIGLGVVVTFLTIATSAGWAPVALASGVVMIVAGAVAAGVTAAAKWILVGHLKASDHPLWSVFVWLNELVDTFVEVMAAPWFARPATGTAVLNLWLGSMGAKVGKGVWCETYWLPEADLIDLRDGATINRGCVVQTHLFHDRMLSMDRVTLRAGATLGPNSVILPAAVLGRHATVGPVSLVMRGEVVPDKTRWIGNPIGPWTEDDHGGGAP